MPCGSITQNTKISLDLLHSSYPSPVLVPQKNDDKQFHQQNSKIRCHEERPHILRIQQLERHFVQNNLGLVKVSTSLY